MLEPFVIDGMRAMSLSSVALVTLVVAACGPISGDGVGPAASESLYPLVMGRTLCNPPSPRIPDRNLAFGVVVGTATAGQSVRAVMDPVVHAREETKIVLTITGTGPLATYATNDKTIRIEPTLVQPHSGVIGGQGDEWGVFFRFPDAGCWRVHVERGDATGDLWFIASPPR